MFIRLNRVPRSIASPAASPSTPFLQKMQLSVVAACNYPIFPSQSGNVNASRSSLMGRRELCFDGISSVCCSENSSSGGNVVCPCPAPVPNLQAVEKENNFKDFDELIGKIFPFTKRRTLFASLFFYSVCSPPSNAAFALGDPSETVEQVKPSVFPSASLFPDEDRIVQLFEGNTYSVVNIFDVTLRPQLNFKGAVEVPEGNGSGFVWDAQGHIVTNYHVIGSSLSKNPSRGQVVARVSILTPDGLQKNFEGRLVGADRAKDLAVLKVEASGDLLRPIKVGASSALRVGQQCLAIGNPFGFDHTLTVGVISGLNRDIFSQAGVTIAGGIQTDAAINPGNSGGPLLDSKGNLIGINTAIFTRSGASAGVGFAIPSSTVFRIVPQLIQYGKTVRAGLNIEVAPDVVANQLNVQNGALVLQVPQNSLAATAGLLPTSRGIAGNIVLGDIIVAVDRKPVKNKSGLNKILDEYNVGDKILLQVRRGSENLELPVVLEEMA